MTATSPRLTILMPLRGRHLFTLRALWHANKARLPYKFILADGQVHPRLASILENSREIFPDIDVEYIRYPDDDSFSRFFTKMRDAISRVCTPYVMCVDNDDFLAFTGIERSMDFLDRNPDYVCCGGGLAGFAVYSGLYGSRSGLVGPLNRVSYRYTFLDKSMDFSSPSASKRLAAGSRNWWTYYAVFRTDAQQTLWREIEQINFSDLQLHELFCAMRTLTLGKARSDGTTIAYLRQYNTSQLSAFKEDWVHHLLRSQFSSDFTAMIDIVSAAAAAADEEAQPAIAEMLRRICDEWLRGFLRQSYGTSQSIKQFIRRHAPFVVRWVKNRRRLFVSRERAALFTKLAADAASEAYIAAFRREFETIEQVLTGPDFADFIANYAPEFDERVSATELGPLACGSKEQRCA